MASEGEGRQFLRHSLATLAYRTAKVLRDAPPGFGSTRVADTTRSACQILGHISDLMDWALSIARGSEAWQDSHLGEWADEVARFYASIRQFDQYLASGSKLACSPERLFQGPVADALTHTGQLAMLRRAAGSAVRGENYFKADIAAGRVGAEQPAPRREFE